MIYDRCVGFVLVRHLPEINDNPVFYSLYLKVQEPNRGSLINDKNEGNLKCVHLFFVSL